MLLRLLILISFFSITFELPNGVEIQVSPPKSPYSGKRKYFPCKFLTFYFTDWFDIFLEPSSVIPLLRTKEKVYYIGKFFRVSLI